MPYSVNLKKYDEFREVTADLLRGEDVRFYFDSKVCDKIYCDNKQYLEFVNHYFINKRRKSKCECRHNVFKIPLLIYSNGLIAKIGWSIDWDKNNPKFGNSESVSLLRYNCKFIDLYVVQGSFQGEDAPLRITAGSKIQTEKRDPLSINLNYGFFETQGTRSYMEDRTYVSLDVLNQSTKNQTLRQKISFIGIYDGHNGEYTVDFLKNYLHKNFSSSFEDEKSGDTIQRIVSALINAFYITENQIKQHYINSKSNILDCDSKNKKCELGFISEKNPKKQQIKYISSGSTAIVCCITSSTLCIGNLGDSRAILCKGGRAEPLTKDHRIKTNSDERERVRKEGGTFDEEGYLSGNLAVSRAFGNWDKSNGKKLSGLSSVPEIYIYNITREDEFIIVACDGIFESIANQEAVSLVRRSLIDSNNPNIAAEKLVNVALQRQSLDNLSVVVLILTPPNSASIGTSSTTPVVNLDFKKQLNNTDNQSQTNQMINRRKVYNFSKLKNLLLT